MNVRTDFASSALRFNPNALLEQLSAAYPTRARGDQIEWGACQWVDGTHSALNYRGHALRRAKIWCQRGDPRAFFRKYFKLHGLAVEYSGGSFRRRARWPRAQSSRRSGTRTTRGATPTA